jgi:hypothetical protein
LGKRTQPRNAKHSSRIHFSLNIPLSSYEEPNLPDEQWEHILDNVLYLKSVKKHFGDSTESHLWTGVNSPRMQPPMPRLARIVAVGDPHHIVQRGSNQQDFFFWMTTGGCIFVI